MDEENNDGSEDRMTMLSMAPRIEIPADSVLLKRELAQRILDYMQQRPYREVAQLIADLFNSCKR